MSVSELFAVLLGSVFINNFVLQSFLGYEHIVRDSKKSLKANVHISLLILVVLIVAVTITFPLEKFVVSTLMPWARTLVYVLVTALSAFVVGKVSQKACKECQNYESFSVILNSIVLGTLLLTQQSGYGLAATYLSAIGSAIGYFGVAMVVKGLRERIEEKAIPVCFRGVPIYLAMFSIISLTIYAFA